MSEFPSAHLVIEIQNKNPVELPDLTLSLLALARQYQRFVSRLEGRSTKDEARLVVKEVRSGSIIIDLIPADLAAYITVAAPVLAEAAEHVDKAKKIIDFAKYLKSNFQDLLGGRPKDDAAAKDLKELSTILDATAKDPGGSLFIKAETGSTVHVTVNHTSLEANAIQNRVVKELERRREPEHESYENVVMQWHTASRKAGKTSDKAVIEAISDKALPVYIEDTEDRENMLAGKTNPFLVGFVVDVDLIVLQGVLRGYKVTKLHQALEDDEAALVAPEAD